MKYRYLILSAMAVLAISCGKEEYTLSGTGEKTPLEISVTMDDSYARTKAENGSFEVNDKLHAYVQQVARTGTEAPFEYVSKIAKLVEFTVAQSGPTVITDNLGTILYWDDFSSDADDIRYADRWLRVGYGFCFNGGTPSTGLASDANEANGTIQGWSVNTDQKTNGTKTSDLLWAGPQEERQYDHEHVRPDAQDKVTLPVTYTHAMSKVTVELNLDEGFSAFGNADTYPTLYANTTASEVNASAQTITATVNPTAVTMKLKSSADKQRVYEAIIAPTVMKKDQKLLDVTVEGNTYHINLTHALLTTEYPASSGNQTWSSHLKQYTVADGKLTKNSPEASYTEGDGGITLPGVNYKMVVTLKKQRVEVQASITDWTDVVSSQEGEIKFNADVKDPNITATLATNGAQFDLWRSTADNEAAYATLASVYTYNDGTSTWDPSVALYWPNGSDTYYFRALSLLEDGAYKSVSGEKTAAQGKDLLWAQTSAHTGTDADGNAFNYAAGAAIRPRTGNVPLTFEHAMSKISVKLQNAVGASDDEKVDLAGAMISIINLYDEGSIAVTDGMMVTADLAVSSDAQADGFTIKGRTVNATTFDWNDNLVLPQSLVKDNTSADRRETPVFYSTAILTYIHADGKSNGTGDGAYYLTDELTYVEAVRYDEDGADEYNASLAGAKHEGGVKEPAVLYTADEAKEFNSKLTGAVKEGDQKPGEDSNYTQAEADEYNAGLGGAKKAGDEKVPAVLWTAPEAKTYNATLPGAVKAGDIKEDAYYKLPEDKTVAETTLTPHELGSLKEKGNKIMMYITLANGTRYSIELSKCLVDNSTTPITEWEKGKHYVYTISLGKEEVTFRALVKDWVVTTGSGNANLDWD